MHHSTIEGISVVSNDVIIVVEETHLRRQFKQYIGCVVGYCRYRHGLSLFELRPQKLDQIIHVSFW